MGCCVQEKQKNNESWVSDTVKTGCQDIPVIRTILDWKDIRENILCRLFNSYRMNYSIKPGLYAVGVPEENSPVFVSCNYKMSFDQLRKELQGLSGWILVLDTKGINVWCAAGKKTFGTSELIKRIQETNLKDVITHKKLILPQLGAPGISAHIVQKETGMRIYFGPVYSKDIKKYLENNMTVLKGMRIIHFNFFDRLILTPMEIGIALKYFIKYALIVFIIFGLSKEGILFSKFCSNGYSFMIMGFLTIITGAFLTPIFLPWIPFRSFALKGYFFHLLILMFFHAIGSSYMPHDLYLIIASYLLFPAFSSYIALNFTGCTTFTSISGVKKELRYALPAYIILSITGLIFVFLFKISEWR